MLSQLVYANTKISVINVLHKYSMWWYQWTTAEDYRTNSNTIKWNKHNHYNSWKTIIYITVLSNIIAKFIAAMKENMAVTTAGRSFKCVRSFQQSWDKCDEVINSTPLTKFRKRNNQRQSHTILQNSREKWRVPDFKDTKYGAHVRHTFNRNTKERCTTLKMVATITYVCIYYDIYYYILHDYWLYIDCTSKN